MLFRILQIFVGIASYPYGASAGKVWKTKLEQYLKLIT